ncbi:MAG: ankyrin repeat domain-containing protein [Polyangia bacterium]|nr:ankyrin repeat domain-containing protein [Polyangia bacterium]
MVSRTNLTPMLFCLIGTAGCLSGADYFEKSKAAARDLALGERVELWRTPTDARGADLVLYLDPQRLLVGELDGGGMYSSPKHGRIKLLDASSGRVIWSASRDPLPQGSYTVLTTTPNLVMLGTSQTESVLIALDPRSGARRWRLTVSGQATYQPVAFGERVELILQTERRSKVTLRRIDLVTGQVRWSNPIPSGPGALYTFGDRICLGGPAIRCHDVANGQPLFTASLPALGTPLYLAQIDPGTGAAPSMIAYASKGLALLDVQNGAVRWKRASPPGQGTKLVAVRADQVLVLSGTGRNLDTDSLGAVSVEDGALRWSVDTGGTVVSALYQTDSLVLFTLEDQLVALDRSTGEARFRTALERALADRSPSTISGTPDTLLVTADRAIVDRDGVGLQGFSFPQGASVFFVDAKGRLSVGAAYGTLATAMKLNPQQRPPLVEYSTAVPNAYRRLTQDQVDRLSYHQLKVHLAGERAVATVQMGMAIGNAIVALGQIISAAFEQAFMSALLARARYTLGDAQRARSQTAIGSRHLHWFEDELGGGVRMVRLDDGGVETVRVGPRDVLHSMLAVGAATVALSPDGRKLVTINLGLGVDRYRRDSSAGVTGVSAAILCFDLTAPKPRRPASAPVPRGGLEASAKTFPDAVVLGVVEAARRFLDKGADPNGIILPGTQFTALRYSASTGRVELVKLLLARGAKPTRLDVPGPTALDLATAGKYADVVAMLEAAGAKRRLRASETSRPVETAKPQSSAESDLVKAVTSGRIADIRRAMRQPGLDWRKAPVVVAAMDGEHRALALELLEAGADPNAKNEAGNTALHLAAARDQQDLMRTLLARKADPNVRNRYGRTPLMNVLGDPAAGAIYVPSMTARATMLLDAGANPNQRYQAIVVGAPTPTLLELALKKGRGLPALLRRYGAR